MGRRSRRRSTGEPLPSIPDAVIELEGGGAVRLRCVMSAKTRSQYAAIASGEAGAPAASREDSWQRAVEFLFERLVTAWTVADVEYIDQRELLQRFRAASVDERAALRTALRGHLAEWFPELDAP